MSDLLRRLTGQGRRRYPIVIDAAGGAEARLAAALREALPGVQRVGLLTDENVARLHLDRVSGALGAAGLTLCPVVVPAGEGAKRLAEVERVASLLLQGGVDRRCALFALGGGVVSDLGGFVAATLSRGIPWAVAPTTLLSQVDAAVGGKTAVNLPMGKNLVGAFHDPSLVYADLTTLGTLPQRHIGAGLGEGLKHALLIGDELLVQLETQAEALRGGDPALLLELVERSCRYKAAVVAADPEERDDSGGRALLNLGHTVGHALETASAEEDAASPGGPLLHGEAVALGLLAAARVSARLHGDAPPLEARLRRVLPRLGLPVDLDRRLWAAPGALRPRVAAALGLDKKRAGAEIRYVVLPRPGQARLQPLTVPRLLELLLPAEPERVMQEESP